MVDLDKTFQNRFKYKMDVIFGTISSIFSPNHRFSRMAVSQSMVQIDIIHTFPTCHKFWLVYSQLFDAFLAG